MRQTLDQFREALLLQCRSGEAHATAEIASSFGTGIVVTGKDIIKRGRLEAIVAELRDRGFDGPILCDADRYSGNARAHGGRGITPAWCRRQAELGLVALTNSGYLADQDWWGLRSILLGAAGRPTPTVAVLPLDAAWFGNAPVTAALTRVVNEIGVPVAVVIEHRDDPFGARYVIRQFLRFRRDAEVPVLLLRCDVSAIGALCHGAHAAAVGTISSLRHLYPRRGTGSPRSPMVSAFVTKLLSYHRVDTLRDAFARTPDIDQFWPCDCPNCEGGTPARLVEKPSRAAIAHSLHALCELRADLFEAREVDTRVSAWHETCGHASYVHEQVSERLPTWRAPKNLAAWQAVTADPYAEHRHVPRQATERTPRPDNRRPLPEQSPPWPP